MIKIITLSIFRKSALYKRIRIWIEFLIYSHIFIGVCAATSVLLTKYLLHKNPTHIVGWDVLFIGSATVILYAMHRYISKRTMQLKSWPKRFAEIEKAGKSKLAIVVTAGILSLVSFVQLDWSVQRLLFIPVFITALYILPVFKGKRLRDVAYIKIFVLAAVWSWLTVIIPVKFLQLPVDNVIIILFTERVFFIFAITIPFDIRDIHTDRSTRLVTLITKLGMDYSKYLAIAFLILALILDSYLMKVEFITIYTLLGFIITYTICISLILRSSPQRDDQYFTGWIDGTMILLLFLIIVLNLC